MASAYYSVVIDRPADAVWAVIRRFDHYDWAGVDADVAIEAGKAGDQVGAVRRIALGDSTIRQLMLAHSDRERSYVYCFCDPAPFPVRDYIATIRVTPVVASGSAFVEWSATFDCAPEEREHWRDHFERRGFAKWLTALRQFMAERDAG